MEGYDGPMEARPSTALDEVMGRLEAEVNEVEQMWDAIKNQLHSVLAPEGAEAPPAPVNPNTIPPPPSPVVNHLTAMSNRLRDLTSTMRRTSQRLDT